MAGIRKVDAPQVRRADVGSTGTATESQAPQGLSPSELSQLLAKAFGNGTLHGNELPSLAGALKQAGPHAAEFKKNLERRLQDPNLQVSAQSLDTLATLGVDVNRLGFDELTYLPSRLEQVLLIDSEKARASAAFLDRLRAIPSKKT